MILYKPKRIGKTQKVVEGLIAVHSLAVLVLVLLNGESFTSRGAMGRLIIVFVSVWAITTAIVRVNKALESHLTPPRGSTGFNEQQKLLYWASFVSLIIDVALVFVLGFMLDTDIVITWQHYAMASAPYIWWIAELRGAFDWEVRRI